MTPAGAARLLALYAEAQAAGERDDLDAVERLLAEAEPLLAEPCPEEAAAEARALLPAVDAARLAAAAALAASRQRLLAAAAAEFQVGGRGTRAYTESHESAPPRFIDCSG
ncbi:MAG: hypothetical protein RMM29_06400 [Planctomycetota bacterium]|nr:hypothetical protein [Planctomycetota bacterium]MCX8039808.1 hypothetical protein [Planctomycetota bacterium]MDW8373261.1 hypothetical protein [Planctomycetota bacterium]